MISLYVDPKDAKKRWLVIIGLLSTTVFSIVVNYQDSHISSTQNQQLLAIISNFSQNANARFDRIEERLRQQGFSEAATRTVTAKEISTSVQASQARNEILVKKSLQTSGRPSSVVTVEYFRKAYLDSPVVNKALHDAGFRVTVKEPLVTDIETNSLWAGDRVPIEDIKLAALTLMQAGTKLKAIRLFCDSSGRKELLIQIGADRGILSTQALSVQEVVSISRLEPDCR